MDRLFLRHNGGQVITLEGNTQIGRGRGERRDPTTWYTDRPKPPDFAGLELVIDIDGSPYMSRNHVGIRCDDRRYTIQDLNSLNSTYKNGWRLEPGIRYPLADGDSIAMGVDTFLVGESPAALAGWEAVASPVLAEVARPEWYLGIAGFDTREHARRVFYTSVVRVARELHRRGYQTEVHGVRPADVPEGHSRTIEVIQLSAILESLDRRAAAADTGTHTFVQYSGHGTREGLVVNETELLTPHTLLDVVGAIRGKKLVVVDACHAGMFLADPSRVPPQTAILVATRTEDGLAFGDPARTDPPQTDLRMTNLARRLWTLLRDREGTFDILQERAALEGAFSRDDGEMAYVQTPKMNTVPFTVCLRSVYLTGPFTPPPAPRARSDSGAERH